jgi:hypothetical protein
MYAITFLFVILPHHLFRLFALQFDKLKVDAGSARQGAYVSYTYW